MLSLTDDVARAGTATNSSLTKIDNPVDLTGHRNAHILNRHRAGAGKPGKTEFPSNWDDTRILHQVSDVATDPSLTRVYSKHGSHVVGTRDGVEIRVNFYPDNHPSYPGRISTAFPTNTPANPKP
jgi:hypothetical protein